MVFVAVVIGGAFPWLFLEMVVVIALPLLYNLLGQTWQRWPGSNIVGLSVEGARWVRIGVPMGVPLQNQEQPVPTSPCGWTTVGQKVFVSGLGRHGESISLLNCRTWLHPMHGIPKVTHGT